MSAFAARVATLQLPLVYLVAIVLGLAVYGSEFGAPSGRVYQLALPPIVIVGLLPSRFCGWAARAARPAALVGIALAAWAYRPLHFAWWDERSLDQALRLAALGLVTAVVAAGARVQLERAHMPATSGLAPALAWIALTWLAAIWQPMLPLLGLAIGFALFLAVGAPQVVERAVRPREVPPRPSSGWLRFLGLLTGLDLSLAAWDWQTLSVWASPLAAGLATAALVAWLLPRLAPRALPLIGAVWLASFALAAGMPAYAISHAHAELAGAMLGALLASSAQRGLPYWVLLGFLPAHLVTQHLAFASLRILLLLPILVALLRARRARAPHPA